MSTYITPGTQFPQYYQFPEFLLRVPISQTAKLAYMILYDRARLSKKNEWVANGKIYTVYPLDDLAGTLGKCRTTIKNVLNELEEHGLLIRKSGGYSKANILYVLIPEMGQFPDPVKKVPSVRTKKRPYDGQDSDHAEGDFPATSKVIEPNNTSKNNIVIQRSVFGRYKNIYLFQEEYDQLCREYPYRIDDLIEEMSAYCASKGTAYQNYEAALRSWITKNAQQDSAKKNGFEDYSFKEGESF